MTVRKICFVALMAALCCILGPLSVPIGAVPISLGVLAVYLCAFVLGPKLGMLSVVIYLLLGLFGLPVFSGFAGGPAKLLGPTGGYLIGFIFQALITGIFVEKFDSASGAKKILMQVVGMILGLIVCYAFGTIWFIVLMHVTLAQALATCVIPFLVFDAAKIVIAVIVGNAVRAALRHANLLVAYA